MIKTKLPALEELIWEDRRQTRNKVYSKTYSVVKGDRVMEKHSRIKQWGAILDWESRGGSHRGGDI